MAAGDTTVGHIPTSEGRNFGQMLKLSLSIWPLTARSGPSR